MVTRYDVESDPQDGPCSLWPVEDANGPYVTYEDYEALQILNLKVKTSLAAQVADLVAQVSRLTDDLAAYREGYGPVFTEAVAAAQITGLAFIRVNANGHVQALPSDRVRISVIQAVEERTAAATHQKCDHLWQQHLGEPEFRECIRCGRVEDVY